MKNADNVDLQKRFELFLDFIAPDSTQISLIKTKAEDVRQCIEKGARAEGYVISEMPFSGSYAKRTGLRRIPNGKVVIDGQDIDIGFVLEAQKANGESVSCMVHHFRRYLEKQFTNASVSQTKSSATITFKTHKLQFDTVPLIKTKGSDKYTLIRTNKEVWQTSVHKQVEFMKRRNQKSRKKGSKVHFNECVRLVKWWRYYCQTSSPIFGNGERDQKVSSYLLDLLCAKAFDEVPPQETYPETLALWFDFLGLKIRQRKAFVFNDFSQHHMGIKAATWQVIDPKDDANNVVRNWQADRINELASWFEKGSAKLKKALLAQHKGQQEQCLVLLSQLFGKPFRQQNN